ncbi:MAG: phosphoglycolate phosphatase [Candidatus Parcubacteria bacterium]|jgi:phosphoglycolate phosphatase|nr:phosphoglycolate phosphatase [Candidatus Parcubacteria bacterium]
MIKNLIFDFDGVIADSFDISWALSREHDETATLEDFLAHHDGNVFAEPRIKFKPERLHEFYSEYRNRLMPSHIERATEPIRRLAGNYSLFIISSNSEHAIKEVLNQAEVLTLFVRILGEETHKSKVEKFRILTEENGITPDNTLFVTDTLGDIKEARKANIRTIAETFGFHDQERLMQGEPFRIADSWEEIEGIISEC